jgi:hypothetical protein
MCLSSPLVTPLSTTFHAPPDFEFLSWVKPHADKPHVSDPGM